MKRSTSTFKNFNCPILNQKILLANRQDQELINRNYLYQILYFHEKKFDWRTVDEKMNIVKIIEQEFRASTSYLIIALTDTNAKKFYIAFSNIF